MDEREFDALEDEVERLAAEQRDGSRALDGELDSGPYSEMEFEQLVRSALDELPDAFQRALEGVAVVVSDDGAKHQAYGLYIGRKYGHGRRYGAPENWALPDEIMIFRDTLVRDFGSDPARLRAQIITTVRHEVGHHLGFDEHGVRRLGL
ncbi:MAG TPA: metallopeptidase family protein [Solirubrobacteraceae bacterium]|nr:metallopeptidase family protein [Solirubrobacteraceae bacterium]